MDHMDATPLSVGIAASTKSPYVSGTQGKCFAISTSSFQESGHEQK